MLSTSKLIRFFLKDFGFFSKSQKAILCHQNIFGRSIVPEGVTPILIWWFLKGTVGFIPWNKLSQNVWLLNFLMVDQRFYGIKLTHCKCEGVNLRRRLPLKSCAFFVFVSYIFRPPVDVIFPQKMAGLCAPSSNLVVAINHFSRFSKPQACLYWTAEMESVQSGTVFFLLGSVNGKLESKGLQFMLLNLLRFCGTDPDAVTSWRVCDKDVKACWNCEGSRVAWVFKLPARSISFSQFV